MTIIKLNYTVLFCHVTNPVYKENNSDMFLTIHWKQAENTGNVQHYSANLGDLSFTAASTHGIQIFKIGTVVFL